MAYRTNSIKSWLLLLASILISVAIRHFILYQGFGEKFTKSYEIVTPLTSFTRGMLLNSLSTGQNLHNDIVKEGLWLSQNGLSPYSGSYYHNSPLYLRLFENEEYRRYIFIACDVFSAVLLFLMPGLYYKLFAYEEMEAKQANDREYWTISRRLPEIMAVAYIFNPLTIATCTSYSLQCVENFIVIVTIYWALSQRWILSSFALGLCIHLSPYYLVLLAPLSMIYSQYNRKSIAFNTITSTLIALVTVSGLLVFSFYIVNGTLKEEDLLDSDKWSFLVKTYGFIYAFADLQPNIGILWYYFTSLFENYIKFFLFVFQYHTFIYIIPLCYRFKKNPFVALWLLLAIQATFKSYPSVGDIALFLSVLPLILHLLQEMVYGFVICIASVCIIVLSPIMWRMWIWTGTGNANFYFAICLVTVLAEAILITDIAIAVLKREFLLSLKKQKTE